MKAPEQPAFWFGFDVSWAKLWLGRVVLFGLLAIDALLQIRHAPRYGAGGFNVAQLPGLDAIGPTRLVFGIAELCNAYLFMLAACGIATRLVIPIATAIYAWLYFGSQLDSYQHHYLVALLLLLACFVPWQRPADAAPDTRVRSWALRLVLVQLGILYLWAAISKLDPSWLDGRTLTNQIGGPLRSVIDATIGIRAASWVVVATELTLAATVWRPRAWRFAAPLGSLLHLGIVFSGLEIGLFAWLMIGLYVFVVPDRVWTWLAGRLRIVRELAARVVGWLVAARWISWVLGLAAGIVLSAICRFPHAVGVAQVLAVVMFVGTIVAVVRSSPHLAVLGLAHALAIGTWVVVDRATTIASDYYRFWGGTSRRLGDLTTAEYAYREMVEVAPSDPAGHFQLGRLLLARNASDEGLAQLHVAEDLEAGKARAYVAEARWLASRGRFDEAIAKAREATFAEPNDDDARNLLDALMRGAPTPRDDRDAP